MIIISFLSLALLLHPPDPTEAENRCVQAFIRYLPSRKKIYKRKQMQRLGRGLELQRGPTTGRARPLLVVVYAVVSEKCQEKPLLLSVQQNVNKTVHCTKWVR